MPPESLAAAAAIALLGAIVYATRIGGLLLAPWLAGRAKLRDVLAVLPACALAAILAPAALRGGPQEWLALAVAAAIYGLSERALLASLAGLGVLLLRP